ncbi:hypothetical protein [uncultured Parvimonas sp.]|uniref:hypothetical protein n=1 Tax=uncultured Parvimonas sp. TaxID=747372 RepID=UPI00259775D5|nr:hypothetical protein [uncultured Parvimonas sp.]
MRKKLLIVIITVFPVLCFGELSVDTTLYFNKKIGKTEQQILKNSFKFEKENAVLGVELDTYNDSNILSGYIGYTTNIQKLAITNAVGIKTYGYYNLNVKYMGVIKPYMDLKVYPFVDACIVAVGTTMEKKIENTNLELSLSASILKNRQKTKVGTNVSLKVYREQDLSSDMRAKYGIKAMLDNLNPSLAVFYGISIR